MLTFQGKEPRVSPAIKLPSSERRAAILKAIRRVFAEKGFDGASTRALAQAAGVSEALLFRHFPNKEAMFHAIQEACCSGQDLNLYERLHALEPSASTLVLLVHFLVSRIVQGPAAEDEDRLIPLRLMLRSLAEDGAFARLWLRRLADEWVPKIKECVAAATDAGDIVNGAVHPHLGAWFTHHLAATVMMHLLPATPVVDYGAPRETLVAEIVRFALRGLSLKEAVIRRHYNPRALALFDD
jgi:AcrR family transcriptional regulator